MSWLYDAAGLSTHHKCTRKSRQIRCERWLRKFSRTGNVHAGPDGCFPKTPFISFAAEKQYRSETQRAFTTRVVHYGSFICISRSLGPHTGGSEPVTSPVRIALWSCPSSTRFVFVEVDSNIKRKTILPNASMTGPARHIGNVDFRIFSFSINQYAMCLALVDDQTRAEAKTKNENEDDGLRST